MDVVEDVVVVAVVVTMAAVDVMMLLTVGEATSDEALAEGIKGAVVAEGSTAELGPLPAQAPKPTWHPGPQWSSELPQKP